MTQSSHLRTIILAVTAFVAASPASAQTSDLPAPVLSPTANPHGPSRSPSTTSPLPGAAAANTRSATILTSNPQTPKLASYPLTVRYLVDPAYPVILTASGLTFSCGQAPDSPTPMVACVAEAKAGNVDLSASYGKGSPIAPILPKVSGKQWKGACAGTQGDVCTLSMSGPQSVGIDFYAKP